ncbi:MAG: SDR family oxidoreductase [Acidimicrobiia bacterium]|nr:SDR family oxidoreductase [Acidimicrobiia bacterium]
MKLAGKVVLITGAGSGIGLATARRCEAEGAAVVGVDIAAGAASVQADVSDSVEVRSAIREVVEKHGRIDVLVNNAGVAVRKPVADQDEEGWDRVMRVNLGSVFLCSKYAIPHMGRGASIVNMASGVGITGIRNRAAYASSKGAIVTLTRNMALDYAARGIRVNCVCPGFTDTPLTSGLLADKEAAARLTALHPLGRLGRPEDIAAAVVFLASEEASWITGIALAVDGGFSAGHYADV